MLLWLAVFTLGLMVFLFYNQQQTPTKQAVVNATKNWSPATEDVYLVEEFDGEWLTIFKNMHGIMIARLARNWIGQWEIQDEQGNERTLASSNYPAPQE